MVVFWRVKEGSDRWVILWSRAWWGKPLTGLLQLPGVSPPRVGYLRYLRLVQVLAVRYRMQSRRVKGGKGQRRGKEAGQKLQLARVGARWPRQAHWVASY